LALALPGLHGLADLQFRRQGKLVFPRVAKLKELALQNSPGSPPNLDLDLDALLNGHSETGVGAPEETLLASCLDGRLVALDGRSGRQLWELNDEPVVKSPYDSGKPVL